MRMWIANCSGIVLAIGCVCSVQAAVYHCVQDGRQVYTDTPCTPDSQPASLPSLNRADPATDAGGLASQFDRQQNQTHRQRDRDDAAWLKTYQAEKARQAAVRKGLVDGRVVVGMTPEDVKHVLGAPTDALGSAAAPRRWSYRNGRARKTVTFKNGRVSGIRRSGSAAR